MTDEGLGVTWSTMWRNSYGRLFKQQKEDRDDIPAGGPDAGSRPETEMSEGRINPTSAPLIFKFSPDMQPLVRPKMESLPEGTDAWAVHSDLATVTPLRAAFAEPPAEISHIFPGETSDQATAVRHWKMKL